MRPRRSRDPRCGTTFGRRFGISIEFRLLPRFPQLRITRLRGCANRSWSARRSTLPTVASPGFSDEPPHDEDHVRESDPEVDDSPFPLGAPREFLVGIVLQELVRSTTHRLVARRGAGLPVSEITPTRPRSSLRSSLVRFES